MAMYEVFLAHLRRRKTDDLSFWEGSKGQLYISCATGKVSSVVVTLGTEYGPLKVILKPSRDNPTCRGYFAIYATNVLVRYQRKACVLVDALTQTFARV